MLFDRTRLKRVEIKNNSFNKTVRNKKKSVFEFEGGNSTLIEKFTNLVISKAKSLDINKKLNSVVKSVLVSVRNSKYIL